MSFIINESQMSEIIFSRNIYLESIKYSITHTYNGNSCFGGYLFIMVHQEIVSEIKTYRKNGHCKHFYELQL